MARMKRLPYRQLKRRTFLYGDRSRGQKFVSFTIIVLSGLIFLLKAFTVLNTAKAGALPILQIPEASPMQDIFKRCNLDNTTNRTLAIWTGDALRSVKPPTPSDKGTFTVEIALAFCRSDISWLFDELQNYEVRVDVSIVTILSKCNNERVLPNFMHRNVRIRVVKLPNKGGCDLAFAHFIKLYLSRETPASAENSVVLFLKDTPRIEGNCHQRGSYRAISDMIASASCGEFICGVRPTCQMSALHNATTLKKFTKASYIRHGDYLKSTNDFNKPNYLNLGDFISREMNWQWPDGELVEVCYGGSFAIPASLLFKREFLGSNMEKLEEILIQGPHMSIVEHFAERMWAAWLAHPLSEQDAKVAVHVAQGVALDNGRYMGTLLTDKLHDC